MFVQNICFKLKFRETCFWVLVAKSGILYLFESDLYISSSNWSCWCTFELGRNYKVCTRFTITDFNLQGEGQDIF